METKTNEKQTKEVEEPKDTTSDTSEGDKPEAIGIVDRAHAENERMEENLRRRDELISREEKLMAQKTLGGRSEAGQVPVEPKEETHEEYAEKVRRGEANPLKDDGLI